MAVGTAAVKAALGQALPGLNLHSGELAGIVKKAVVGDWRSGQLLLAVYASKTFKARFPAIRNADGTLRMSPGAYIQQETSLRQTMQSFGLGWWHYNKPSDFADFIARGVTAQDLQHRLDLSQDLLRSNPQVIKQMQSLYGLSASQARSGALGWLLDPKRGTEKIQQQITASQIMLAAKQAGFATSDLNHGGEFGNINQRRQFFEGLAGEGVTGQQANQAFQQAGLDRAQLRTFAARYHTGELSDQQIASALFHPDPEVAAVRQQLFSQEASQFRGGAGFATGQGPGIAGLQTTEAADR